MSIVMLPHNPASEGAKAVVNNMRITRIKREGSSYKHREENIVINWGCPVCPPHIPEHASVINPFKSVAKASDKLSALNCFIQNGVNCPPFTTDKGEAYDWMEQGRTVVVRTILNGHGGKGIEIYEPDCLDDPDWVLPNAPLYTQYVPKKSEYRVHVVGNEVIDVTRKVLSEDYPDKENVNWKVRNHDNGFIFTRFNKNVQPRQNGELYEERDLVNPVIKGLSIQAVRCLGLDFGAVDIIWNSKAQRAFVLEVNTAPGVADTAAERYAAAFVKLASRRMMLAQREKLADMPFFKQYVNIQDGPPPIIRHEDINF